MAYRSGEAAAKLGVNRGELETMVAAGKVEAVGGYSRFIPTSEVERLTQALRDQIGRLKAETQD